MVAAIAADVGFVEGNNVNDDVSYSRALVVAVVSVDILVMEGFVLSAAEVPTHLLPIVPKLVAKECGCR